MYTEITERSMAKRGRRPKPDPSAVLSTRVPKGLRDDLEGAAAKSGRKLSDEVQRRLRASFDQDRITAEKFGGPRVYGLVRTIALALKTAGETTFFAKNFAAAKDGQWLDDPFAYAQAVNMAITVFEKERPDGEPKLPRHLADWSWVKDESVRAALETAHKDLGSSMGRGLMAQIDEADPTRPSPSERLSQQQILIRRIAADLNEESKSRRKKRK
jgi:hypothetical protein